MSNTSNYNIPLHKPKKTKKVDDDIDVLEKKHDYYRTNSFKWFILILAIVTITCVAICFIWKFFTVETIQKYILNQIINNFVFIIVSVFAILKINIPTSN